MALATRSSTAPTMYGHPMTFLRHRYTPMGAARMVAYRRVCGPAKPESALLKSLAVCSLSDAMMAGIPPTFQNEYPTPRTPAVRSRKK